MATINGARALESRPTRSGRSLPGKAADVICVDLSGLEHQPLLDPLSRAGLRCFAARRHRRLGRRRAPGRSSARRVRLDLPAIAAAAARWGQRLRGMAEIDMDNVDASELAQVRVSRRGLVGHRGPVQDAASDQRAAARLHRAARTARESSRPRRRLRRRHLERRAGGTRRGSTRHRPRRRQHRGCAGARRATRLARRLPVRRRRESRGRGRR